MDLCCLYPPDQLAATTSWPGSTSPRLALGPSSALSGRRGALALPLGAGQGQRRGGEAGGGAADAADAAAAEREAREVQAQVSACSGGGGWWCTIRLRTVALACLCIWLPSGVPRLSVLFEYSTV